MLKPAINTASVEMMVEDSQTAGIVAQPRAVNAPTLASNRRAAVKPSIIAVIVCRKGAASRTAQSASPNTLVVAAIIQAIMGGLEKYPQSTERDQSQYWVSSAYKLLGSDSKARMRRTRRPPRMSAVIRIQLREGESEGVGLNFSMKGFMRLRRRSVKALA